MPDELRRWRQAAATFVGRASCARCHESETRAWTGSHHDQAMTEPTEATVRGDFSGPSFEGDGMKARFLRDGTRFLIETEGPAGKTAVFEVAYTFAAPPTAGERSSDFGHGGLGPRAPRNPGGAAGGEPAAPTGPLSTAASRPGRRGPSRRGRR
jgi:hypothetical protein